MKYIESQFGNPRGIIGHLVGLIMAYENRSRNRWALSLLNIQPKDRILEIGFGSGWAIQQASRLVTEGLVAGVDSSETMVSQALFRNRRKVKSGQIVLQYGSAINIPFEDNAFDKAYTVNSFHEWNKADLGIRETSRVLVSGGTFLIVEHPHEDLPERGINHIGERIQTQLADGGFQSMRMVLNSFQNRMAVGMIAKKS